MPYPSQVDPKRLGAISLGVAERKGWEGWSLRDVATEVGVSPNALYRYVGDRAGLVIAMGQAAADDLTRALFDAPLESDDRDARVAEMSARFVTFATGRPHAFAAFNQAKPDLDHPALASWIQLWARVNGIVREAVPDAADATAFALWAFLNGRVELARGPAWRAEPQDGLQDAVLALLAGFRARSPVVSPLPPHARMDPSPDIETEE